MTIYAIVNNLLPDPDAECNGSPIRTIISQAVILQGGNPYFVPDFAKHFEARLGLAVKIGKLGKGIAPRFASRYVDSAAPCVLFVASDLLQALRKQGLPWTSALSYDKCLAIGKFAPISMDTYKQSNIRLTLESSADSTDTHWSADLINPDIEETLAMLSRDNTLKTGDMILCGIAGTGPEVFPDLRASLSLNDNDHFKFNIR